MLHFIFLTFSFILIATSLPVISLSPDPSYFANQDDLPPKSTTGELYYHPNCPHCHTVLNYLNSIHKKLTLKNTSIPRYQAELQRLGQKVVPTLVIGSKVIVGSDQIIDYLKKHPEILEPV